MNILQCFQSFKRKNKGVLVKGHKFQSQYQVPIILAYPLIVIVSVVPLLLFLCPCSPHSVIIVPHRSPLLLLLCLYISIVIQALIILGPLSYIQKVGFYNLNHPRIVHLCNVKEVSASKWLISKVLISLFFYFWSWFHNIWCQSFGLQGFAAPNRSSWNFCYKFFYTKVQKL